MLYALIALVIVVAIGAFAIWYALVGIALTLEMLRDSLANRLREANDISIQVRNLVEKSRSRDRLLQIQSRAVEVRALIEVFVAAHIEASELGEDGNCLKKWIFEIHGGTAFDHSNDPMIRMVIRHVNQDFAAGEIDFDVEERSISVLGCRLLEALGEHDELEHEEFARRISGPCSNFLGLNDGEEILYAVMGVLAKHPDGLPEIRKPEGDHEVRSTPTAFEAAAMETEPPVEVDLDE